MPWGVVAGAAIGAVGSIISSNTQADAQQQAAQTQADMFNKIVSQEQPFLTAGTNATTTLQQLLGTQTPTGPNGTAQGTNLQGGYLTQTFQPTVQQLQNLPGYQFQQQQGLQALTNQLTPTQGALSGATLKSLMGFNQDLASTYYNNYYNQFQQQQQNIFNRLSSLASLGQNAAGNLGNQGAQLGSGIAQAQAAAGASQAAGISGAANNIGQSVLLSSLYGNNQPQSSAAYGGTGMGYSQGYLQQSPSQQVAGDIAAGA